jgi:hypothetical protein
MKLASKIIQDFLSDPLNRQLFDDFYALCFRHAKGYLIYLKRRGWVLPEDQFSGENALEDLCVDILGPFLRSDGKKSCCVVFDYFTKKGIQNFATTDGELLFDGFKTLLFGFIGQEMSRLGHDFNPQFENIKRRFRDILNGNEYRIFTKGKGNIKYVCRKNKYQDNTDQRANIPYDRLLVLVEEAYRQEVDGLNRIKWCSVIFELLEKEVEFADYVKYYEIITAASTVNARQVDLYGSMVNPLPSPQKQIFMEISQNARYKTIAWLRQYIDQKYVIKGRLSDEAANAFITAVDCYLLDLAHSPIVEKLPVYFREVMPEKEHAHYLSNYKNTFEYIIEKSRGYFMSVLKENPQIRNLEHIY